MDLAALLAPIGIDRFERDWFGRQPLHIPANPAHPKSLLAWERLSDLLAVAPHWTPGNIALILNRRPVTPEHYMDKAATLDGPVQRADPAKIETFLAMGASLVGNYVEQIAPELRALTDSLGERFAGLTNANVYASFRGVQGFATHYDLHEVFALQCAGTKRWRIYANRAEDPIEPLATGGEEAQRAIDAARGPLAAEVRMAPGDMLYLPRGTYHDALAQEGASLHVTLSVAPHSGQIVVQMLREAALADPAFRRYLPDGRTDRAVLAAHLADLGTGSLRCCARRALPTGSSMRSARAAAGRTASAFPPHRRSSPTRGPDARPRSGAPKTARSLSRSPRARRSALPSRRPNMRLRAPPSPRRNSAHASRTSPAPERDALIALLVREGLIERYTPRL